MNNLIEKITSPNGIVWTLFVGCSVCESANAKGELPFIGHFNCLYIGKPAIGHDNGQNGHCTANSCY